MKTLQSYMSAYPITESTKTDEQIMSAGISGEIEAFLKDIQTPKTDPSNTVRFAHVDRVLYDWFRQARITKHTVDLFDGLTKVNSATRKRLGVYDIKSSLFRGVRYAKDKPGDFDFLNRMESYIKRDNFTHFAEIPFEGDTVFKRFWYRSKIRYTPKNQIESWTTDEFFAVRFSGYDTAKNGIPHSQKLFEAGIREGIEEHDGKITKESMNLIMAHITGVSVSSYIAVFEMDEFSLSNIAVGPRFTAKVSPYSHEKEVVYVDRAKKSIPCYLWIPAYVYYAYAWGFRYSRMKDGHIRFYNDMSRHISVPLPDFGYVKLIPENASNAVTSIPTAPNQRSIGGKGFEPHPNGGGMVCLSSRVDPSCYIGKNVIIKDSKIGKGTRIEGNVVVSGYLIGENCRIHGTGSDSDSVSIVSLSTNVNSLLNTIGANVRIKGKKIRIGHGCYIHSDSHIYGNVYIESSSLMAPFEAKTQRPSDSIVMGDLNIHPSKGTLTSILGNTKISKSTLVGKCILVNSQVTYARVINSTLISKSYAGSMSDRVVIDNNVVTNNKT